jgi:hypothetical protein
LGGLAEVCPNPKIKRLVSNERKKFFYFRKSNLKGLTEIATSVSALGLEFEIYAQGFSDYAPSHYAVTNCGTVGV